jgi:hypothetical protein
VALAEFDRVTESSGEPARKLSSTTVMEATAVEAVQVTVTVGLVVVTPVASHASTLVPVLVAFAPTFV